MQKIDIHVHAMPAPGPLRPGGGTFPTPKQVRAIYDAIGVSFGVLQPQVSPECAHDFITNADAMEMARLYGETFDWFMNIDPRTANNRPEDDLSYYIGYYKERGAKGVGEISASLDFDDARVYNLFKHCEAMEMPVLFHLGEGGYGGYGLIDRPGLTRLEAALAAFPRLLFLGHSALFWSEIGGDLTQEERRSYPSGRVKPGGRVVELMRKYPNLLGDLSAGSGANAMTRDPEFACRFIETFQDRLLFGTDIADPGALNSPMLRLSAWLDEALARGNISPGAYENVCRANALRLLKRT